MHSMNRHSDDHFSDNVMYEARSADAGKYIELADEIKHDINTLQQELNMHRLVIALEDEMYDTSTADLIAEDIERVQKGGRSALANNPGIVIDHREDDTLPPEDTDEDERFTAENLARLYEYVDQYDVLNAETSQLNFQSLSAPSLDHDTVKGAIDQKRENELKRNELELLIGELKSTEARVEFAQWRLEILPGIIMAKQADLQRFKKNGDAIIGRMSPEDFL